MKRLFTSFLAILFLFIVISPSVAAITLNDLEAMVKRTPFYDPHTCEVSAGSTGNGPLYGPAFPKISDPAGLAAKIKEYIQSVEPSSGLVNNSEDFVKYGQQYNVNPVMLVLVGQKETQLGTDGGIGNPPKHNFWGNRAGSGWASYPNYAAAIEGYFNNLRTNSAYAKAWAKGDAATVEDIIFIATPPSENDTAGYVKFVKEVMQKILGGADTNPEGNAAVSGCGPVTTSGALGWDLTGSHAMVSYDQTDPNWSRLPYGAGKSSIGASGCGPSSLAMIGATLLGDKSITPLSLANQYGAKYHTNGTAWSLMPVFARDYGLKMQDLGRNLDAVADVIKAGGLVLISVDPGHFTSQGHFMVIRAVTPDGTGFYLNDPNGKGYSKDSEIRAFTADFLRGEGALKNLWGYTK